MQLRQGRGTDGLAAVVQQPAVQQPPRQGGWQTTPAVEIETIPQRQARKRQGLKGGLTGLEIFEHLPKARQAALGTRADGLQERQHLQADAVAAVAAVVVGRIRPDGQIQLTTAGQGVAAPQDQQRPHQGQTGGQGPAGPQAGQPPQPTAPDHVEHQGLGPVSGGVTRDNATAAQPAGLLLQAAVPPATGRGLTRRGFDRTHDPAGQPQGSAVGSHMVSHGGRPGMPAVVGMQHRQGPVVQRRQVMEQGQQRQGVLATGHRQQERRPGGQQTRPFTQMAMELVVPAAPGAAEAGWDNRFQASFRGMSPLASLPSHLQRALAERRLFKLIAGLANFDAASVDRVARAGAAGGADLLDIACDPALVRLAATSGVPVAVSAVDPDLFPAAVAAGAVLVEIGNYDSFYPLGRTFEAEEVLALTRRSRQLLPGVPLSVTVPHRLPLDQQERLAVDLVTAGADLIQTEGGCSARPVSPGVLGLIEKAAPTLAAAHTISRAVDAPVLCASGLSAVTVPLARAAGASGIGVGSAVNRLSDELAMVAVVRGLREALDLAATPAVV